MELDWSGVTTTELETINNSHYNSENRNKYWGKPTREFELKEK